jgi:hypothetical protein
MDPNHSESASNMQGAYEWLCYGNGSLWGGYAPNGLLLPDKFLGATFYTSSNSMIKIWVNVFDNCKVNLNNGSRYCETTFYHIINSCQSDAGEDKKQGVWFRDNCAEWFIDAVVTPDDSNQCLDTNNWSACWTYHNVDWSSISSQWCCDNPNV